MISFAGGLLAHLHIDQARIAVDFETSFHVQCHLALSGNKLCSLYGSDSACANDPSHQPQCQAFALVIIVNEDVRYPNIYISSHRRIRPCFILHGDNILDLTLQMNSSL